MVLFGPEKGTRVRKVEKKKRRAVFWLAERTERERGGEKPCCIYNISYKMTVIHLKRKSIKS